MRQGREEHVCVTAREIHSRRSVNAGEMHASPVKHCDVVHTESKSRVSRDGGGDICGPGEPRWNLNTGDVAKCKPCSELISPATMSAKREWV